MFVYRSEFVYFWYSFYFDMTFWSMVNTFLYFCYTFVSDTGKRKQWVNDLKEPKQAYLLCYFNTAIEWGCLISQRKFSEMKTDAVLTWRMHSQRSLSLWQGDQTFQRWKTLCLSVRTEIQPQQKSAEFCWYLYGRDLFCTGPPCYTKTKKMSFKTTILFGKTCPFLFLSLDRLIKGENGALL